MKRPQKMGIEKRSSFISIFRFILLGVSIVLIYVGIFLGDLQSIYQKAIYICLECVGIG